LEKHFLERNFLEIKLIENEYVNPALGDV
jgi:hypothetical protein